MKQRLPLILLLSSVAILFAGVATAATVAKLDMEGLVESSDAIVIAQVRTIESAQSDDGRVYSTIELQVEETLKGTERSTITLRQLGGRDLEADIATVVPGMPEFEPSERVFLFLHETPGRAPVVTGLSQGKFSIALGPDAQTEFVIPRVAGLHLIADDRALRDPPPGLRTDLDPQELTQRHRQTFHQVHDLASFRQEVLQVVEVQAGGPQ